MTTPVPAPVEYVCEFPSTTDLGEQLPENSFVWILSALEPKLMWGSVGAITEELV